MQSHKDLAAWKQAMSLAGNVYRATADFPREEMFGLTGQMRRAAVSVPSNIAEGAARMSKKEFAYHAHVALGSLSELETQCIISMDLGFLKNSNVLDEILVVKKILCGLIRHLKKES